MGALDPPGYSRAQSDARYSQPVRVSSAVPNPSLQQPPSGRAWIGVYEGRSDVHALSTFGLSQNENIASLSSWTDKGLPSGVSAGGAAGAARMVYFKGNYYLQALASG